MRSSLFVALALAVALPLTAAAAPTIPWMHDDYPAARAAARAADKPLVIDLWAPWCHTCLSMKHTVLQDPAIVAMADRFVWLALDTDRPENAAALTVLPIAAWPTFYVTRPADEAVQARQVGGASVEAFRGFLEAGAAGHRKAATTPFGDQASRGDRAAAGDDRVAAEKAWRAALAAAPAGWIRRPGIVVSILEVMHGRGAFADCARFWLDHRAEVTSGATAAAGDSTYYATACAEGTGDAALLETVRRAAAAPEGPIRQALAHPDGRLSADDRSDALRILREVHDALGDKDAARAAAHEQRAVLDGAAAAARTPLEAMTWHWPRAEVYVYLGVPAELVPALEASVAALPDQYDPPYRLAWVQLQVGHLEAARAAAEKAVGLAYGPRKARVLSLLADIHAKRGDRPAERAARQGVVDLLAGLPVGQRSEKSLDAARAALSALDAPPPPPPPPSH